MGRQPPHRWRGGVGWTERCRAVGRPVSRPDLPGVAAARSSIIATRRGVKHDDAAYAHHLFVLFRHLRRAGLSGHPGADRALRPLRNRVDSAGGRCRRNVGRAAGQQSGTTPTCRGSHTRGAIPEAIPEAIPMVQPSAMYRLITRPATTPSALSLRIAWAASLVALLALAGAAYVWQRQVVSAWPPTARAYALFGMQPTRPEGPR